MLAFSEMLELPVQHFKQYAFCIIPYLAATYLTAAVKTLLILPALGLLIYWNWCCHPNTHVLDINVYLYISKDIVYIVNILYMDVVVKIYWSKGQNFLKPHNYRKSRGTDFNKPGDNLAQRHLK